MFLKINTREEWAPIDLDRREESDRKKECRDKGVCAIESWRTEDWDCKTREMEAGWVLTWNVNDYR